MPVFIALLWARKPLPSSFLADLSKTFAGRRLCRSYRDSYDVLDEVIKYSGWMESSPIKLMDYVDRCLSLGFYRFCVPILIKTATGRAGIDLYKKLLIIRRSLTHASGGVSSLQDIEELSSIKVESCV